jgi:glutamine synthetase
MDSSILTRNIDYDLLTANDPNITIAEYIWIDGSGQDLRSKAMVIPKRLRLLEEFPLWNADGSSTMQASTEKSEIMLKPVYKCPDPFRKKRHPNSYLVLCEAIVGDAKTPANGNFRYFCKSIMDKAKNQKPWFGFEQEYILFKPDGISSWPLGFPQGGYADKQGSYYCGVGMKNAFGRVIAENHLAACLAAGLTISGINAEVFPGQWEYQVGIVEGVEAGDQLWISRYILRRVAEDYGLEISFDPKPVKGDWNGSGCHCNFSSVATRTPETGLDCIFEMMDMMNKRHKESMKVYGPDNDLRLTGDHETSAMDKFSHGMGSRGASVRIPTQTIKDKCGYFEDRRPAANCDPYLVSGMLVDTVCNDGKLCDAIVLAYESRLEEKIETPEEEVEERTSEDIKYPHMKSNGHLSIKDSLLRL